MKQWTFSNHFSCTVDRLWAFHALPDAFERLIPPGDDLRLQHRDPGLFVGAKTVFTIPVLPLLRRTWEATITEVDDGHRFVDEQTRGPFASWRHEHVMNATADGAELIDTIQVSLPWFLPPWPTYSLFHAKFTKLFHYRREVIASWLDLAEAA